jgi:hypothetical protein
MRMKFLWVLMALIGVWFLASAATPEGLLPSGHGAGRTGEILIGIGLIGYGAFRLWSSRK